MDHSSEGEQKAMFRLSREAFRNRRRGHPASLGQFREDFNEISGIRAETGKIVLTSRQWARDNTV